jgi:hypothetical protein
MGYAEKSACLNGCNWLPFVTSIHEKNNSVSLICGVCEHITKSEKKLSTFVFPGVADSMDKYFIGLVRESQLPGQFDAEITP